jgi:hypothetical protein
MSSGYTTKQFQLAPTTVVGASQTAAPVSTTQNLSSGDSLDMIVEIGVSAFTEGAGITGIVQHSHDGVTWATAKSGAISGTGVTEIKFKSAYTETPVRPLMRVVVTTTAGSSITINSVRRTARS